MCQLCRYPYNFIGHYETLYTDAQYVIQQLGILQQVEFPQSTGHESSWNLVQNMLASVKTVIGLTSNGRDTERARQRLTELSADTIRKLTKFYHNDFETLGYNPSDYL